MSLTSLPAEILLNIFTDERIDQKTLKSLRLAHRCFGEIAAEPLFRRLHLHFEPKPKGSWGSKPLTTTFSRVKQLTSRDPDRGFRAEKFREVSIVFRSTEQNGFTSFTAGSRKFLSLFGGAKLERLSVAYTGSEGEGKMESGMAEGQRRFFGALCDAFEGGRLAVENLAYEGVDAYLPYLEDARGLKGLSVTVRPHAADANTAGRIYDGVGTLLRENGGLESLELEYVRPPSMRPGSTMAMWFAHTLADDKSADRVLERVPDGTELAVRKLKLGMSPPNVAKNVAKLRNMEELDAPPRRFHSAGMPSWAAFMSCGIRLKVLRGGVASLHDPQLLRYLASCGGRLEHLELATNISWSGSGDDSTRQDFRSLVIPAISGTLRRLALRCDVMLPYTHDTPEIGTALAVNAHFGPRRDTNRLAGRTRDGGGSGPQPGRCFHEVMMLLRGFPRLRGLHLALQPGSLGRRGSRHAGVSEEYWPELSEVCKGWRYRQPEGETWEMWSEGMELTVDQRIHGRTTPKFVYVLERNEEGSEAEAEWAFRFVETVG